MKKNISIILLFLIVSVIILVTNITALAMMGTGMAGYDDETADKKLQEEQQEWKKEQEERITKSSNNYLKSLSVDKYDVIPNFDKQTINYEVKGEIKEDKIKINAEADDEKATISGNEEVSLEVGENNLEITVTAENGTVRTYYIKVKKTEETNTTNNAENESYINTNIENEELEKNEFAELKEEEKNNIFNKKNIIIVILIVLIIIVAISMWVILNKKGYHSKH